MQNYFTPISFKRWQTDPNGFADALGRSFRETGFAVIEDHPIPHDVINHAVAATKAFFALPEPTKVKYFDKQGGGQRGYTPFKTENAKNAEAPDLKEFWHTGRALAPDSPHRHLMKPTPSVSEIESFDPAMAAFYNALDECGRTLLRAIALHLDLSADWFDDKVQYGNSILRLLHYPPQAAPPAKGSVRAGAHEDINVITLLLGAEEAGLEVLHASGQWLAVNPPANAIVINCGDMLQRLTAGLLPSTTHRVVNPKPERAQYPRYSTPFFLHFNHDALIEALPQCVAEGGRAEPPIHANDYLLERLREIGLIKS